MMGIVQAAVAAWALGMGLAPATPAPLPVAPSEVTVGVAAGKAVRVNVAAPPLGSRPKEWPLLRIGSAKYEHPAGQPAIVTLEGSIQTAAKVDYRITVTLLAEGGKEVAATSTVEHVQHMDLGRVLTEIRTWKLDFGKGGDLDRVKALRIQVFRLGSDAAHSGSDSLTRK